jgi:putative transposase
MEEKEMGRKRTPGEEARRELIRELLSNANVTEMEDIQRLFKETIAELLEGSLDAELEETLGYGRYDHTARTESGTTNSRNGHSRKTLKTSAGKIRLILST